MRLPESPPPLHVEARREGTRTVLTLAGELDAHAGRQLAALCHPHLSGEEAEVVIELGGLEFADVAGVCALAALARGVLDGGVHVVIREPSALVCRVLARSSVAHLAGAPQHV